MTIRNQPPPPPYALKVDKSYTEEIAELRKTQSELKHEEGALMRQRAQDMRKLQDERVQRYSMVLRGLAEEGQ